MRAKNLLRGKYDSFLLEVLKKTKGQAAALIIVKGSKVAGATIHEDFSLLGGKYFIKRLPDVLRQIAQTIEREANTNGNGDSS